MGRKILEDNSLLEEIRAVFIWNKTCLIIYMNYSQKRFNRHSIRTKGHDYSKSGWYFVTICTHNKEYYFGNIKNGTVIISDIGYIVIKSWLEIPHHFDHVQLDEFIVMPDHMHGIIYIKKNCARGVQLNVPVRNAHSQNKQMYYSRISPQKRTLGVIIRTYKAAVTTLCRQNGYPNFQWQRNYFDRIIHNKKHLIRVRIYIKNNPKNWNN